MKDEHVWEMGRAVELDALHDAEDRLRCFVRDLEADTISLATLRQGLAQLTEELAEAMGAQRFVITYENDYNFPPLRSVPEPGEEPDD